MLIQVEIARSELRAVLDSLGDELRRGGQASAGRVRMQARRALALYASARVDLPMLEEILQRAEGAAISSEEWMQYATSAPVAAERVKGFRQAPGPYTGAVGADTSQGSPRTFNPAPPHTEVQISIQPCLCMHLV